MNRLPGIGLRGEIALNLFLFVAMMLVMMAFLLFDVSRESVVVQRIEDKRGLVESILDNLESRLDSDSDLSEFSGVGFFREILTSYRDGGFFKEARVYGSNGKNLLWVGNGDRMTPGENNTLDVKEAMESQRLVTRINKNKAGFWKVPWGEVVISAPVRSGGEIVGGIQIISHITEVKDGVIHYNWNILILLACFSLLMVVVISYSLGHEVVNPIKEILAATKRVGEGDLDKVLSIKSGNEIGKLASSFNNMMAELRENRVKMVRYVKSLKEINKKLKQAEHHVIQTEKLATVGRLAAGVAHEIGNPLGALYGYLEVVKKKVSGDEAKELLVKIEKETNHINEIIFGLLDLSRQGKGKKELVKVNELIEKTVSLLSSQNALSGIESRLHLKLDIPDLRGDPREYQQVVINIIINALESMPSGGLLTIRTGTTTYQGQEMSKKEPVRRDGDPQDLDFSPLRKKMSQKGQRVELREGQEVVFVEVADTGKGIKREDLSKIFDPFFTLKDKTRERGTGLGLAVCERIIKDMGGLIQVESVWGKGSTFTFYLPITKTQSDLSEAGWKNENHNHRGET
jgi:signal transduction histidine kinase